MVCMGVACFSLRLLHRIKQGSVWSSLPFWTRGTYTFTFYPWPVSGEKLGLRWKWPICLLKCSDISVLWHSRRTFCVPVRALLGTSASWCYASQGLFHIYRRQTRLPVSQLVPPIGSQGRLAAIYTLISITSARWSSHSCLISSVRHITDHHFWWN